MAFKNSFAETGNGKNRLNPNTDYHFKMFLQLLIRNYSLTCRMFRRNIKSLQKMVKNSAATNESTKQQSTIKKEQLFLKDIYLYGLYYKAQFCFCVCVLTCPKLPNVGASHLAR